MDEPTLAALVVWSEARGELPEGRRAVYQVVRNRMAKKYLSDGTIAGTVLSKDQFSGFWFDMINGKYTRVCSTREEAKAKAEKMLTQAQRQPIWGDCVLAVGQLDDGSYEWSPQGRKIVDEPDTVMYCNMAISHPAWATPEKQVCTIQHHTFFTS